MSTTRSSCLTERDLACWRKEGWLVLLDLLPLQRITDLQELLRRTADAVIDRVMADGELDQTPAPELPWQRRLATLPHRLMSRHGRSWRDQLASPELYRLHHDPALVAVLRELVHPELAATTVWNARPKLPHQTMTVVPWHQDASYYGKAFTDQLFTTAWIPAVPVDEANGCMQVVPGSHRRGQRHHAQEQAEGRFLYIDDDVIADDEAITVVMQPGDVLFFHPLIYHRSLPNVSDGIRWSVDLRYAPLAVYDDPHWLQAHGLKAPWVVASDRLPSTSYQQWQALLPW